MQAPQLHYEPPTPSIQTPLGARCAALYIASFVSLMLLLATMALGTASRFFREIDLPPSSDHGIVAIGGVIYLTAPAGNGGDVIPIFHAPITLVAGVFGVLPAVSAAIFFGGLWRRRMPDLSK